MAEEPQDKNLEEQLALLQVLASKPLLAPPVFVRMCGSIPAGILLRQTMYWMGKTDEPGGWFYKELPKFHRELCMGEKEFRTARGILAAKGFLETERRGTPPVVFFRLNLRNVLAAVHVQIRIDRETDSAERTESIKAKGQNQLRPKAAPIAAKGQNPNSGEKAEILTETTREHGSETTGERPRRKVPSPSVLIIAQRQLMEAIDRRQPPRGTFIENPEREEFERVQLAAADAGLSPTQAKEFLATLPGWRDKKWLTHLDSQQPLDFGPDKPPPVPVVERQPPEMEASGLAAWEFIRDTLKHRTNPHSFETWIKPLRPAGILRGVLYVRVPTVEFRHVEEKFSIAKLMAESGAECFKGVRGIEFVIQEQLLNLNQQEKTTA